ncbi:MAG: M23 family metallopeptidase, partial [Treponema sp.]|nr:M23 family metallopeptidase [Treponema sp.]
ANLSKILVEVNDSVTRKTKLGLVGNTGISTGPHLHFAISKDGEYVDPEAHCINLRYR